MHSLTPKEVKMKRGKRYQEAQKLVDNSKVYSAKEALDTIQKMPKAKFD